MMESRVSFDADMMSEMLGAMGKELKLARSKIKELENQPKEYKVRAETAEYALEVMRANFEDMSVENHRLRDAMDELRDTKVGIKQEVKEPDHLTSPPRQLEHSDKSVSTEVDGADDVQALQKALEMYYGKYKTQKEAKNQLRDSCRDLKTKVMQLGEDNENLKRQLENEREASKVTVTPAEPSDKFRELLLNKKDVQRFMESFPKPISRIRQNDLSAVCLNSIDLKTYVLSDPQLKEVGMNLLCLPGRIAWSSSDKVHGLALGPMHIFKPPQWVEGSVFVGLYGRTFHLFYTTLQAVYYAGLYKAIDLRTKCSDGISVAHTESIIWLAIAQAASGNRKLHDLNKMLASLYSEGVLKVEPLGLQCISFDADIYNILRNRFTALQSTMISVSRQEELYPEGTPTCQESRAKKRKTG